MSYLWATMEGEFKTETHSVPTDTKSIGTDLSMTDIGSLEDLQREITELKKEVASLEAKLKRKGKREFEHKKHRSRDRTRNEIQESEGVPGVTFVCNKELSLVPRQHRGNEAGDDCGAQPWRSGLSPPPVFKHEPMEMRDSVSGSEDERSEQEREVPALFLQCYADPSATEAHGHVDGNEDEGKGLEEVLPLSLHCYSDPSPAETLGSRHSGGDHVGDGPSLSPMCKPEPNPTDTLEPERNTVSMRTLQNNIPSLSLYCYTQFHQSHAQDSDYSSEDTLQELEEDVPSLSLHCYSDPNPTESLGSDCDGGDQHTLQAPLKMCSVRLVDCRKILEVNGAEEEENDYFEKDLTFSNVHRHLFSYERPSASEHDIIPKGGPSRSTSLVSRHIMDSHLIGNRSGGLQSSIWHREEFFTPSVPSMHLSERNGEELLLGSPAEEHFLASTNIHQGLQAAKDKLYPCSLCGKIFTDLSHRKSHERMHSGQGPYQCSQCGESFSFFYRFQNHLKAHAKSSDVRTKPHHCTHCKKQFATKGSLIVHSRVHTGERPYPCSFCDQAFTRSDRLRDHERVHTGEKPYRCSSCGKQFAQAASLRTHQRIHTGEKPYCCPSCDKRFSDLTGLRTHERRHTGERPYHCSQCGKSFAQASNLVTHLRRHGGKVEKCNRNAESL